MSDVLQCLEDFAPLRFAEPWDNVGLLVEPLPLASAPNVERALLTIDLSDAVVAEARELGAELVIAYHPPIFSGLKRLRSSQPGERVVLACARLGISVFSPHTALDAAPDGVNAWLLDAFAAGLRAPCVSHPLDVRFGQGRSVALEAPLTLADAVARVKQHLGLSQVRVSAAPAHVQGATIRRIAVCAGAGGAVFEKLSGYDLYVTGEMRHHDVRERAASGASVILCEHTNTERGFLRVLAARLAAALPGVRFEVSSCDRDPLSIV
ncbi:MAG TPA: Nif3-like dinuclear metal center hexameric protein [Polyangiaceae bacterium]|nr:Nif3-like dinuclear metal center hexameric protein [Polyangiaceae bacterium]